MMFSRSTVLGAFAAAALLALPAVSEAQVRIGVGAGGYGRGVGIGYGGYGYGRGIGYGPGYGGYGYNRIGPAYGVGWGRPGIGIGVGGIGIGGVGYGYGVGSPYGQFQAGYPNTIVSTPNVVNQSFYPTQDVGSIGQTYAPQGNNGTALVVVTVPPNAEVMWNGVRTTLSGETRRFRTGPLSADGAKQTFQARWTGPDGQPVTQDREVQVTPNGSFTVNFNEQAQSPAPLDTPPQPLPTKGDRPS